MLQLKSLNRYLAPVLLCLLAIFSIMSIYYFDGTGDAGDSVLHYLFARYAPQHPALFFDHWAKPVFVLLASPFAQFGFTGIKIFNALVVLLTIWLSYRSAVLMKLNNTFLIFVLMGFAPLYYILTYSGLTEPLFALFVSAALYLSLRNKLVFACILLSFIPLVRSEGLIILGVYVLYLLLEKKWKYLPLLLSGTLIYSLIGFPFHHDLFWVFTKIPYARLSSTYGHGQLFHFVNQLLYVVGVPIYLLFWIGFVCIWLQFVQKKFARPTFILVMLGFCAFFVAHSLFWYLGIFNSMGLKRVLICIMPLIALIALYGFNALALLLPKFRIGISLQVIFVIYIVIFPLTSNPASVNWKNDLSLNGEQKLISDVGLFIQKQKGNTYPVFCTHPYLSIVLNIDHFDRTKRLNLSLQNLNSAKSGSLIVWENWFAVLEENVTLQMLDSKTEWVKIKEWSEWLDDREKKYVLYRHK